MDVFSDRAIDVPDNEIFSNVSNLVVDKAF